MTGHQFDHELSARVGVHPRTVQRGATYPKDALFPQVRLCSVCCAPIDAQYVRCSACNKRYEEFGSELADLVAPLSYAVKNHPDSQQFYFEMFQYKESSPSRVARERLEMMLISCWMHHRYCLEDAAGEPFTAVIPVPSGRGRAHHPLEDIARLFRFAVEGVREIPVVPARFVGQARTGRPAATNPDDFAFDAQLSGHVLILEDMWVQGHTSQAVAIKARQNGAQKVTIIVLARLLDYSYPPTKVMVDCWKLGNFFDPHVCPVNGEWHCPDPSRM